MLPCIKKLLSKQARQRLHAFCRKTIALMSNSHLQVSCMSLQDMFETDKKLRIVRYGKGRDRVSMIVQSRSIVLLFQTLLDDTNRFSRRQLFGHRTTQFFDSVSHFFPHHKMQLIGCQLAIYGISLEQCFRLRGTK